VGEAVALTMTMPDTGGRGRAAWTRVGTSLVLIPLFVWAVLGASPWVFQLIIVVAAGAATWELLTLLEHGGRPAYRRLGVVLALGVTASFLLPGGPVPALAAASIITLAAPLVSGRVPEGEPAAVTLLGLTYVAWLLGHALLLQGLPGGGALVLLLVGVTWVGETAAYAVGSTLGTHPLAPSISPRKTVEGSVAQIVGSAIAALALGPWLVPAWALHERVGAGVLLGVAGQMGDLAESVIKRSVGAKDASALIPGHGGVLDRLDGLLFNTPALFYYARLIGAGS
jgi:phosphatidate cytidylyltransferase